MAAGPVSHPYWPKSLSIPNYRENERSTLEIVTFQFSVSGLLMLITWTLTGKNFGGRCLSTYRRLALCWFTVCSFIHIIIEGWFSLYYPTIPGDQSFLSQLWKEYSKGDSRYVISDNFAVCLEAVTACLWGPFSLGIIVAFVYNHSYRFVLQLIVSLGQLYGSILYFFTEHRDGYMHSEYGHPIYFWFYFIFMNVLWIVVPFILIMDSWFQLSGIQALADKMVPKQKIK